MSLHAFFAHSKFQVEYSVSFRGERLFLELLREADGMVPGLEKMAFHSWCCLFLGRGFLELVVVFPC